MSIRKDVRASQQPCWIIDYADENKLRHRMRVYCTYSVAKRKYWKILDEIENRKMGYSSKLDHITLEQLIKKYINASEIDGKSHLTVKRIQNATDAFSRIIGLKIPISAIDALTIEEFKKARLKEYTPRKTRLTKAGLNTELKHCKALFNWAYKMSIIITSPFKNVQFIKTESKPIRFLSPTELKELFNVINKTDDNDARDLFTFYLQLGARRSEILPPKCTWNHIDMVRKNIVLIGKRQKRRSMPLNDTLITILQNRINDKYPFDITTNRVTSIILKYYQLAGIMNANVHTLRKTCGALLIQAGVDIYRVSKWLGHSTVTVTERHYIDLLRSEYDDLAELIGKNHDEYVKSHPNTIKIIKNNGINRSVV